ncbi:YfhO family protein [Methylosinus sp. Sm6]|uniref:YfhO family protein n=1 Tax=Methylosinus sp. Sm6 TaxID=2866948 RepID=UPI001C9933FA|nr:YfhO family protein [Methylosinus sp. Sm6]
MDDRRSGYGAATLIFLVGAGLLASPWLSGRVTIPWDAKAHFYPQFVFLAHALHQGQSPFWTPNVFAGSPQLADPQSLIFAPFFLVAAALSGEPSFILEDAITFAMLAMGGLALMAYFRDRGFVASGALVAAFAFAFGGSAAWRIQHTGQVMSLAWFPVTLFLLARALDRRSAAYGAAAGLVAAFLVLGRDQVAFLEVLLLAAYALFRVLSDERGAMSALAPLLAGAACGLAVIAVPLALTMELAAASNRPAIDLEGALRGSLHPAALLTLVSANMFGTDGPLTDFWGPPSAAFGVKDLFLARNMCDIYMGALPLLSLIAALAGRSRTDREMRFFAGAAAAFTLYAIGRFSPAFAVMFHFPGVDLFRRPADATFPLGAVLAILAGYGLHLVVTAERAPPLRALAAATLALFALAALVAFSKDHLGAAAVPLAESAVLAALAFLVIAFARRLSARPLALLAVVGATMTLDLAVSNGPNESTALPPATFDALRPETGNETIALLREKLAATAAPDRRDRVELAAIGFHWPNASLVHGFDHDLGYNPIRLALFEEATGAGDHVALPEQRVFSPLFPAYRSTMADLIGLRYIAAGVPIEEIDKSYKPGDLDLIARTADAYVYENKNALPRVLLATCAVRADFAQMVEDGRWPEIDYRTVVLLEESPICHNARAESGVGGGVRLASYGPTQVVVEVDAPRGGGHVVLNDVYHPAWTATLDGAPAPVLRANVMFRAVAVPEGRHELRFAYRPFDELWRRIRAALRI